MMTRIRFRGLLLVMGIASVIPTSISTLHDQLEAQSVIASTALGGNHFSMDLFNALIRKNPSNMIVSPFSLRSVMAMLQAGAEGKTKDEIRQGMKFPESNAELIQGYHSLISLGEYVSSRNKTPTPITIDQANRVFIQRSFRVKPSFQSILKQFFQSPLEQLDFSSGKKAAAAINAWISQKTQGRIERVVESDALGNNTKLVLVNTLFLKGPWDNPFHPRDTRKESFFLENGQIVSVDMMRTENYFVYQELNDLNAKAIVIPYEDNRFHFVILLPNNGLRDLESRLTSANFSSIIESYSRSRPRNIVLGLPKFTIASSHDLVQTMRKLGMTTMFEENGANFGGIAELGQDQTLVVSKLIQKAFVTVDEKGSEAGAASFGAVFNPLSVGPQVEKEIIVNRPFLGFIHDTATNSILFLFRKVNFD